MKWALVFGAFVSCVFGGTALYLASRETSEQILEYVTVQAAEGVAKTKVGWSYKEDDTTYYIPYPPSDKESEALIRKWHIHIQATALGSFVRGDANEPDNVRLMLSDRAVYVREGFSLMNEEAFTKFLEIAKKKFVELGPLDADTIKNGLGSRDLARPHVVDGKVVEGDILVHKVIVAYWTDVK